MFGRWHAGGALFGRKNMASFLQLRFVLCWGAYLSFDVWHCAGAIMRLENESWLWRVWGKQSCVGSSFNHRKASAWKLRMNADDWSTLWPLAGGSCFRGTGRAAGYLGWRSLHDGRMNNHWRCQQSPVLEYLSLQAVEGDVGALECPQPMFVQHFRNRLRTEVPFQKFSFGPEVIRPGGPPLSELSTWPLFDDTLYLGQWRLARGHNRDIVILCIYLFTHLCIYSFIRLLIYSMYYIKL